MAVWRDAVADSIQQRCVLSAGLSVSIPDCLWPGRELLSGYPCGVLRAFLPAPSGLCTREAIQRVLPEQRKLLRRRWKRPLQQQLLVDALDVWLVADDCSSSVPLLPTLAVIPLVVERMQGDIRRQTRVRRRARHRD